MYSARAAFRNVVILNWYDDILQLYDVIPENCESSVTLCFLYRLQRWIQELGRFMLNVICHNDTRTIDDVHHIFVLISRKIVNVHTTIIMGHLRTTPFTLAQHLPNVYPYGPVYELEHTEHYLAEIADQVCMTGEIQLLVQALASFYSDDFVQNSELHLSALTLMLHRSSIVACQQNKHISGQTLLILEKCNVIGQNMRFSMPRTLERIYEMGRDTCSIHEVFCALTNRMKMSESRTAFTDIHSAAEVAYKHDDIELGERLLMVLLHTDNVDVLHDYDAFEARCNAAEMAFNHHKHNLGQQLLGTLITLQQQTNNENNLCMFMKASILAHKNGHCDLAFTLLWVYGNHANRDEESLERFHRHVHNTQQTCEGTPQHTLLNEFCAAIGI